MKLNIFQRARLAGKSFVKILSNRNWQAQSITDLDRWLDSFISGSLSSAGMTVNEITAMNLSAVWNAALLKANTVALLPIITYERIGKASKKRAMKHYLWPLLHESANPEMSMYTFKQTMQLHLELVGNAYAQIIRDGSGAPVQLWPLNPMKTELVRTDSGKIIYKLRTDSGKAVILQSFQVFHIPNLSWSGRLGYNVIQMAARSLGIALAQDEYSARFFSQGATPSGIMKYKGGTINDFKNVTKNFRKAFDQIYKGPQNANKVMILDEDWEYQAVSLTPEQSQLLGSRLFSVQEVARWFNVPLTKLKDLSNATYSNISQEQLNFYLDTMLPVLKSWEDSIKWKLLLPADKEKFFSEFLIDAILRGDPEARNKAYAIMRMWGVMSTNEWRAKENMNPIKHESGNAYVIALNYMNQEMLTEEMVDPQSNIQQKVKEEEPKEEEPVKEKKNIRRIVHRQSYALRKRIELRFRPIFKRIAKDILKRQNPEIMKIAKSELRNLRSFDKKIKDFYEEERGYIKRKFQSVYIPYSELIHKAAAKEINLDEPPDIEYNKTVNKFVDNTTERYISSSTGQLKEVVRDVEKDKREEEVQKRLDEWEEKRPDKIAHRESVDGNNGLAAAVWVVANFKLMWVAIGNSCPFCLELDGKIVGGGGSFINPTTGLTVGGNTLSPSSFITHPGAHTGCDCTIVPTT